MPLTVKTADGKVMVESQRFCSLWCGGAKNGQIGKTHPY